MILYRSIAYISIDDFGALGYHVIRSPHEAYIMYNDIIDYRWRVFSSVRIHRR